MYISDKAMWMHCLPLTYFDCVERVLSVFVCSNAYTYLSHEKCADGIKPLLAIRCLQCKTVFHIHMYQNFHLHCVPLLQITCGNLLFASQSYKSNGHFDSCITYISIIIILSNIV